MGSSVSQERPPSPKRPPLIKVPIFGAEKSGKTSLLLRFKENKFDVSVPETVAADLNLLTVSSGEQAVRHAIMDCSGKERYWMMVPAFARDAVVIVVVYDITSESSLTRTLRMIEDQAYQATVKSTIFLVGNKGDLKDGCEMAGSKGEEVAKNKGYVFIETSAMTGQNVRWLFEEISRRYLQRDDGEENSENRSESIN
ncbi:P-loop containing nucleoside triphosphate hydrolase protein [Aspergillus steynii IBT 23096]|uniref:P-loop containing nucleoside triphosphate hydrolase protein n=1 Tax=Aspergillus steynii IBT 23096 TaxID=1392250 RepID=A0A2I2GMF9_9EURO|nr:P-loop containing nucleoside triphosphate hydrolase protein [Aspergillus steynii IBT 23096]PLB54050.1 P-loop containing nucleoside triphosphate hydrolase protein [Aspergillus steynii IBT 23096]